jgi:hypothetical protein
MNKSIRGPVINGDASGQRLDEAGAATTTSESAATPVATTAPSAAAAGLAAAVRAATAEHKAQASAPKPTPAPASPVQPAFEPPVDQPAVARDEHHGSGGQYHIVDGKRVRVEPDTTQ